MKWVLFFLTMLFSVGVSAQDDWHDVLHQWLTAEDMEESYGEETMEQLEELAATPLNLNQTSREELEQLPFLSAQQVEGLVEYLDHYRPVRSLSELHMIKALDLLTCKLLRCFVTVGPEAPRSPWPQWKDISQYGKHTLMITGNIPFYERQGDRNGYLGYRYRHDLRYQFTYNQKIKLGLTAAQDAGEPFFSQHNKWGYDHYSYYFQLRDIGRLRELNIGMYRVQLGLGLVINTGFHLGKLATLQTMGRSTHTLKAHSSRSQAGYLQGVAATVQLSPNWQITSFASRRPLDATLNDDGTVRTLLTDGYHRTPTEIEKKHNTHETDLGTSIGWRKETLYIHANAVYTHFDRSINPQTSALYRQYAAQGSDFFNASVDYGYNNYRWGIAGETAINGRGALAAIHTLTFRPSDNWSLVALHRYYDKRYTAIHARSFCEGSSVQNEHGIYCGTTWQPSTTWQLQAFVDYAHFAWARYRVSTASDAFDTMLSARYNRKKWSLSGRYRLHIRQQDNSTHTAVINKTEHRARFGMDYTLSNQWSLSTQGDGIIYKFEGQQSRGFMVSERATWHFRKYQAHALVGWFCTDDYNSRISLYERSVAYAFGFPMYYGRGLRSALLVSAHIGKRLQASGRIGVTKYFNRSVIGSGLQQVCHSSLADLLLQIKISL